MQLATMTVRKDVRVDEFAAFLTLVLRTRHAPARFANYSPNGPIEKPWSRRLANEDRECRLPDADGLSGWAESTLPWTLGKGMSPTELYTDAERAHGVFKKRDRR